MTLTDILNMPDMRYIMVDPKALKKLTQSHKIPRREDASVQAYIYGGEGVSSTTFTNALYNLFQVVNVDDVNHEILTPESLLAGDWLEKATVLIMPGGRTRPVREDLGYEGIQLIREFVRSGGLYLGYCAGAYFGSGSIEFAKNDPEHHIEATENLDFFPGKTIGPVYGGFRYNGIDGVHVVPLTTFDSALNQLVYFHGGCLFENADNYENVTVLARYPEHHNAAAIVMCNVGKGRALLCGPHIEYSPELIQMSCPELVHIRRQLEPHDEQRKALNKALFAHLLENKKKSL